jgi:acid phosphatase type 7
MKKLLSFVALCTIFVLMVTILGNAQSTARSTVSNTQNNGTTENVEPYSFLLTWQNDPTSTMTIDWHVDRDHPKYIEYKYANELLWRRATPDVNPFPYSDRLIYRVELTDLKSDAIYQFRFGGSMHIYKFRTMPVELTRPILFANGGDMMHSRNFLIQVNAEAIKHDLDFVTVGGDLAYADGKPENVRRWYDYLSIWATTMITADGRVIPHIAAIGNHEVKRYTVGGYEADNTFEDSDAFRLREAPYFMSLMAFPGQPGYNVLDFGTYLSLVILDTYHLNKTNGPQREWLRRTLLQRRDFQNIIPIYHVPAYPSVRDPTSYPSRNVRRDFVPLFDGTDNIRIAFENHDHTYKRTIPLKNNRYAEDGIVYLGDGAWGVWTREVNMDIALNDVKYLEAGASVRHFILTEIAIDGIKIRTINERGELIDAIGLNGSRILTMARTELPENFTLEQNYPNPFNAGTVINYAITQSAHVRLDIFTLTGQLVQTLVNQTQVPGWYRANFSATELGSGTYIYQLRAGDRQLSRRMLIIK